MRAARMKPAMTGVLMVLLSIAGLAGIDQFLARVESAELRNTAQSSYLAGSRLLREGKAAEAIDPLREAHELERQDPQYELQLIAALTAAQKTTDAEPLLTDILQRQPNDGQTNLLAARMMAQKGSVPEAKAYYHRAIYGEWPGNSAEQKIAVRMELVDFLVKRNEKRELLPELIFLEAEGPKGPALQERLGHFFLLAGAPARAAGVFRALLQRDPADVSAYAGLGQAELEQGQYRAARSAFLEGSLRDPNNQSIREYLKTLNTVTEIDPTIRQLTSAEKYRRSVRILDMTHAVLEQCVATNLSADTVRIRQLMTAAEKAAAAKPPPHITNEMAEGILSLAQQLWQANSAACPSGSPDQNTLNLIMQKLAS